jgi:Pyridoxamine 5'-phosphate oxidase
MTADEILAANRYMTIATTDAAGVPWVSPVWFAFAGRELFWVSYPHRRHSRNIAERPQVAIVVFDSTVVPGHASAVYMEATAELLEGAEREPGIDVFSQRSVEQGIGPYTLADVEKPEGLRLYRARVTERWILDERDNRRPA